MRTKQEILEAIVQVTEQNGGSAPGRRTFEEKTGITAAAWRRFWSKWSDAVAEAGLTPNQPREKYDRELLLTHLAEAVRHYGRVPSIPELNLYGRKVGSFPNESTIRKYLSSKATWISELRKYCESNDDFKDVLPLLGEPAIEENEEPENSSELKTGWVYLQLLTVGREKVYTIGNTLEVERRARQISKALPYDTETIHQIETDDAYGIEKYWHARFEEKRTKKKREWFKLTSADVKAFKRRKYQ